MQKTKLRGRGGIRTNKPNTHHRPATSSKRQFSDTYRDVSGTMAPSNYNLDKKITNTDLRIHRLNSNRSPRPPQRALHHDIPSLDDLYGGGSNSNGINNDTQHNNIDGDSNMSPNQAQRHHQILQGYNDGHDDPSSPFYATIDTPKGPGPRVQRTRTPSSVAPMSVPEIIPYSDNELENIHQSPDATPMTSLQALSLSIVKNESSSLPPAARPIFWHGLQGTDVAAHLPPLDRQLGAVDWRSFLDLTQPHLWYPLARLMKRKIILHCGPTNSGKTHRAMVRLQEAKSGLYCGPLRLLAWENYERLNNNGVPCSLLTGQEVVEQPNAQHISTTVEMVNLERMIDVAVIDEIQMLQDPDRGFAWSRALLGIPAKEIHLCGDKTTMQWLQELTAVTGEELHICEYNRLSPLVVQDNVITGYQHVKKGDCVVAFSRKDVYALKKKIEQETGKKVAIIYGGLPPVVRKQQARLFNDPHSGYDILVASDAIGMGLNLNIGRIIFSTIVKFDGNNFRKLTKTEVLQIGGRAGRFNTQYHRGLVTCMHKAEDLEYIRDQFRTPLPAMEQAHIFPSTDHLISFCRKYPDIPLSEYIRALPERARLSKFFTMTDIADIAEIASKIDHIVMPAYNRVMLCYAPVSLDRFPSHSPLLQQYATDLLEDKPISVPKITYRARPAVPTTMSEIELLEETYNNLDLYVWLWYRMGDIFYMHTQAQRDRDNVASLIHTSLSRASVHELSKPKRKHVNPHPNDIAKTNTTTTTTNNNNNNAINATTTTTEQKQDDQQQQNQSPEQVQHQDNTTDATILSSAKTTTPPPLPSSSSSSPDSHDNNDIIVPNDQDDPIAEKSRRITESVNQQIESLRGNINEPDFYPDRAALRRLIKSDKL